MTGEVQLREVADIIMGQSPPGETYNDHGDGLPFFQGVADFGYRHPTPRVFCIAPSRIAVPGDILLSVRAPIGRVNVADRRCAIGRGLAIVRPKVLNDGRYLEFALRLLAPTWQAIEGSGSVFGNATRRDLETLRVPWPKKGSERRAIAHILGTLDDKIELNRRMSQTLEAIARALFKAWFVDFEPVRAKMEGRWQRTHPLPLGEGRGEGIPPLPLGEGRGEGSLPTKSHVKLPSDLLAFTRELRRNETDAERLLWRLLRNRSLAGAKFRRQHPFPPYVLDFYCHELKLAIELDGGQHNLPEGRLHDQVRTAKLAEHGIRVLRFWNHEVLRNTESVLEAVYQAIVKRREELRPSPPAPLPQGEGGMGPSLPAHLYDLFPDRLVDSELGEIPEGWRVVRLSQVIEINPARSLSKGQVAPYLDMANMPTRGHIPQQVTKRPYTSGTRFVNGDTLLARITPCLENGKTAFVDFLPPGQVGWGSTEFIVLRPKPPLPPEFGYCLARDPDFREFAIQSMTGTSGRQRVQPEALARYLLVVPSGELAKAFGHLTGPMFRQASHCMQESRTLAALRDALLAKLIRGEIRVKDAERFLMEREL